MKKMIVHMFDFDVFHVFFCSFPGTVWLQPRSMGFFILILCRRVLLCSEIRCAELFLLSMPEWIIP